MLCIGRLLAPSEACCGDRHCRGTETSAVSLLRNVRQSPAAINAFGVGDLLAPVPVPYGNTLSCIVSRIYLPPGLAGDVFPRRRPASGARRFTPDSKVSPYR